MWLESKIESIIARTSSSYETDRAKEVFLTIPSILRTHLFFIARFRKTKLRFCGAEVERAVQE
jgi:hypothetical protein